MGGRAEDDIRESRMDRLIVLLSISRPEMIVLMINSWSRTSEDVLQFRAVG